MAAYVVVHIAPTDPERWEEYRQAGMPTVAAHGGKVLCAGPGVTLDGEDMPPVNAVVEFPTAEAAQAWYHSAPYQEASRIRRSASKTLMFGIVPGVPDL